MKRTIVAVVALMFVAGLSYAGTTHVKHHMNKKGQLVHEGHVIVPGGEPWQYWVDLQGSKSPNRSTMKKMYHEPFGEQVPNPDPYLQFEDVPELTDSQFDTFDQR